MAAPTTSQSRKLVDALEAGGLSPLLVKVLRDNLPKLDAGAVSHDEFALLLRRLAGDDLDKALASCGGAAPPPVTRVRLSSLVPPEGRAPASWHAAVAALAGALKASGFCVLLLDEPAADTLAQLRRHAAGVFTSSASTKALCGVRALSGVQRLDTRSGDGAQARVVLSATLAACDAASAALSAAGRVVLSALSRALPPPSTEHTLPGLMDARPLPPGARSASMLSLLRYDALPAGVVTSPPHDEAGLLSFVSSLHAGLEVHTPAGWAALPGLEANEVVLLAGCTLQYASGGLFPPCTRRVVSCEHGSRRDAILFSLRGEPSRALPVGKGVFSNHPTVALLEASIARAAPAAAGGAAAGGVVSPPPSAAAAAAAAAHVQQAVPPAASVAHNHNKRERPEEDVSDQAIYLILV